MNKLKLILQSIPNQTSLLVLMTVFLIGAILNILKDNALVGNQIVFIDTKTCATLLVSLFGISIARRSYAASVRPFIVYEVIADFQDDLEGPEKKKFLEVFLKNAGSGFAIFKIVKYRCDFGEDYHPRIEAADFRLYSEILTGGFKSRGLNNENFTLVNISSDSGLASKDQLLIFRIEEQQRLSANLTQLDLLIEYTDVLGYLYTKKIHCIPRRLAFPEKNLETKMLKV